MTERVMRHWNRLFKEGVDSSSLALFKTRFDEPLGNLVGGMELGNL